MQRKYLIWVLLGVLSSCARRPITPDAITFSVGGGDMETSNPHMGISMSFTYGINPQPVVIVTQPIQSNAQH